MGEKRNRGKKVKNSETQEETKQNDTRITKTERIGGEKTGSVWRDNNKTKRCQQKEERDKGGGCKERERSSAFAVNKKEEGCDPKQDGEMARDQ